MKKLLLCMTLAIASISAFAQKDDDFTEFFKLDQSSGDYYYEEIVKADGLKKEVIFERAKNWIIANFKTGDNNIKFDETDYSIDNSAAIKVDKKNFVTSMITSGSYNFKFHVWCKDNRYRMRVDNVMYNLILTSGSKVTPTSMGYSELKDNKMGRYLKNQAGEKTSSLVAVFNNAVLKGEATSTKKDEW